MASNFFIATLTASFTHCKKSNQLQLGSLFQHNAFLFHFNPFTSGTSSDSESDRNHPKGGTFTLSYLINSCGLSAQLAIKLSKGLNLTNPNGPNAVLHLLKNYGFSETQVAKLVKQRPSLLFSKAEKTLLPKFKFFQSIGVSNSDMPKILIGNPDILSRSLRKCIIPRYDMLRGVVRDDQEVVRALRQKPRAFTCCDIKNTLVQNIRVLRLYGVPQSSISLMLRNYTTAAYMKHSKFVEVVKTVVEIGFDPRRAAFVAALHVLLARSQAVFESRFKVYERWGWNRKMALQAFRKFPNFMKLSEENFTKKMSFIVNDLGWPSEHIAEFPYVLGYSMEKGIIPRLSVVRILKSKGLIGNDLCISSFLFFTEEIFLKRYVFHFQQDVPLLPDVYKGLINYQKVI